MSRMLRLPQLLDVLKERFDKLTIVETGTIRNVSEPYREGDGWSTLHIARWLVNNPGHSFTTIDLDTSVAENFLRTKRLNQYVNFVQADSLTALPKLPDTLHFVLLDSANDAKLTLAEFIIVEQRIPRGGIVVIDDVIMDSKEVLKGHLVIPYVKNAGYKVVIANRLGIVYF